MPMEPLTAEDLQRIRDALRQIDEVQETIARAKAAGIDVSAQERTLTEQRNRLLRIKQAFFPHDV